MLATKCSSYLRLTSLKKPIPIGRNPDDSAGIMYDMITFEVDVTDPIPEGSTGNLYALPGLRQLLGEVSCMIIYPIVSVVVANQFIPFVYSDGGQRLLLDPVKS